MNIVKVSIRGVDIPIKKGLLQLVDYRDETVIEVELIVHPTIAAFIDTLGFVKETISLWPQNHAEIKGRFKIHPRASSVLLTSSLRETEGADDLAPARTEKGLYFLHPDAGVSLLNELKTKQISVFTTFLQSLLEHEIKDEENRVFLNTLLEKLIKGEKLNPFDQYLKNELTYVIEEAVFEKV